MRRILIAVGVLILCSWPSPLFGQEKDPTTGGSEECHLKITRIQAIVAPGGGPWQPAPPADQAVPHLTVTIGEANITHPENVLVIKTTSMCSMTVLVKEGDERRGVNIPLAVHSGTASNTRHRTQTRVGLNKWDVVDDLAKIQSALRDLEDEGLVIETDIFDQFEVGLDLKAVGITGLLEECSDQRQVSDTILVQGRTVRMVQLKGEW